MQSSMERKDGPLQEQSEEKIHVTFSGFTNKTEKVELLSITNRIANLKVEEQFTENVTHVIMKTDPKGSKFCNRTLKYLQGVSQKCWVLNSDWIINSAVDGTPLPEEIYEITGNIIEDNDGINTQHNHNGPSKARQSREKLFANLKFYLFQESEAMSTEDAVMLIKHCGGSIVRDPEKDLPSLILCLGETENKEILESDSVNDFLRDLHDVHNIPVIERGWLIDSISSYSRKCYEEYMYQFMLEEAGTPRGEHELVEDSYDDEDYIPSPSELMNFDSELNSYSSNDSATSPLPLHDASLLSLTDTTEENSSGKAFAIPLPLQDACTSLPSLTDTTKENSSDKAFAIPLPLQDACTSLPSLTDTTEENSSSKAFAIPLPLQDACKSLPSLTDEVENNYHTGSITVQQTHNTGSRKYDKQFMCLFCETPQAKLPRHFKAKHSSEIEVAKYLAETEPKIKNKMLKRLRNLGAHQHNLNVIKEKKGVLTVVYRPSEETKWSDYIPCPHCFGYYISSALWKHVRRCELAPSHHQKYGKSLLFSKMLLPVSEGETSVGLRKILLSMKDDTVSTAVKNDYLIRQLGEKLSSKHVNQEQYHYIRNCLREMGRLLLSIRKRTGSDSADLSSFIDPVKFDIVVQSTKEVAGYSAETTHYKTPSLALKIGFSIKKCAGILKGNALKSGDSSMETKASKFIELYDLKWNEEITPHALRTLEEVKRNKVQLIPLTNDVILLNNYLQTEFQIAYQTLTEDKMNKDAWSHLCEIILAQIILFNRRRQGEASKLKVLDYHKKHCANQEDVLAGLTELEKNLCARLEKVDIIGKRGRTVPVILTAKMTSGIDLLLKTREDVGVKPSNTYVFARTNFNSVEHIRGCDVLREFSNKCGAEYPHLLRSTKLRKHIATLSQVLNLKDNELDVLARFLGHDIKTHREYYRLPEEAIQVAKVSKLLLTLERGEMAQQRGLSLDEIEVDLEEVIEMYPEDDGENEDDETKEDLRDEACMHVDETGACMAALPQALSQVDVTRKRVPWSHQEQQVVLGHFNKNILLGRLPGKTEIENLLRTNQILQGRTWRNVKDFIRNKITSLNRKK